jgi:hypothetical protein
MGGDEEREKEREGGEREGEGEGEREKCSELTPPGLFVFKLCCTARL